MKIKNYSLVLLAILMCLTTLGGCASSEVTQNTATGKPDTVSLADSIDLDFSQIVMSCSHIVDGQYLGMEDGELLFRVTNTYKGKFDNSDPIYVLPFEDEAEAQKVTYQVGNQYLLFLQKYGTVYHDHEYYAQTGWIYLPETDNAWETTHNKATSLLKDSKYAADVPSLGNPYTTSLAVADAVEVAENIFVVKIDGIDGVSDVRPTTVYYATVVKTIRNQPSNGGQIMITLFNDTVEIGEEYVVLLNRSSETSIIYTLASRNSVFTVEAASMQASLGPLLKMAKDYNTSQLGTASAAEQLEAEMKANAEELEKNPELKAQLEKELERLKEAEKNAD